MQSIWVLIRRAKGALADAYSTVAPEEYLATPMLQ